MTSVGTRWKVAHVLERLKRTCWCNLVDYVLSHGEGMDLSERQFLFRRTRDENGEVTRYSLLRTLLFHHDTSDYCIESAKKGGSCYCGKFATKEVCDTTSMRPKFVLLGDTVTRRKDLTVTRTDGWLSA